MRYSVSSSWEFSAETPCMIETTAPAVNRPTAANRLQTYASRP